MLVVALALLSAGAPPLRDTPTPMIKPRPPVSGAVCRNARPQMVGKAAQPLRMRPLGQEPAGDLYLGVVRLQNGCELPIMIREKLGDGAEDQR